MKVLLKFDSFMHTLLKVALVIIFALITIVASIQIFYRFVLENPLTWTDEFCRYCLIWLTLVGIGVAAERKSHIAIDVVCSRLPPKGLAVLSKFWNLCVLAFCAVLIKYGCDLAALNMAQYSAGMHVQLGYIYYAVPFGGIFTAYYNLLQLFGLDKKLAVLKTAEKGAGN